MEYLTKKEYIQMDAVWKRTFLEELKRKTGKYSHAGDGGTDWVRLAWLKSDVWWSGNALERYEAQDVPAQAYLWTDNWRTRVFDEKPSIDELWAMLGALDAVYFACFTEKKAWTFILTHEDHPTRYIYSEKFVEPLEL